MKNPRILFLIMAVTMVHYGYSQELASTVEIKKTTVDAAIPDDFPIGAIPYFSPIYSTKNGDIIGTIGGTGLVKYNGKGQILERCFYCDYQRGSQVVMYTESLLSLPGDHEEV
jgi:hypothetical protein